MPTDSDAWQDLPPTHPADSADRDATRYGSERPANAEDTRYSDVPADPEDAGNPSNTRYSNASADPDATDYAPSSDASHIPAVYLPRRFGNYELLEEIGRGGMGVVYKARQLGLNRFVALKMILSGDHAGEADLARFRAEAEAVARLQHPNIVQIYEIGEADGRLFFSLEFCPGGSLDRSLNGAPLPPAEAARLTETLARAVHAAHRLSVVHRDLKPSNVLLAADGSPKITDFGLAKRLDDVGNTQTGAVMGTPGYMAPEQAAGKTKEIGPAADVYALGAVLYECLTGRPPFRGPTTLETLRQVTETEPVPPRLLQPRTPRDLQTVCLKCLEKHPGLRYATALDLAEDLQRFQAGEPVRARPISRVGRAWRSIRRNPGKAMIWVLVLLALLLGGAYAVAAWQLRAVRERTMAESHSSLTHQTREAGLLLLGAIRQQRTDTYWQAQPDRGDGRTFYARDLFEAARNGASREEAVKRLTENVNTAFADRSSYLWVRFVTRDATGGREVLRLERNKEGGWTPVVEETVHPHRSDKKDYLGFTLHPKQNQALLTQVDSVERGDGAKVPVLLSAAFVRKPSSQPSDDVLGLVVVAMDLSADSGESDKPASDDAINLLTDETGKLLDGPPSVMNSAGTRRWDAVVDELQKMDAAEPLPLDVWDAKPLIYTWERGYLYPSVHLKPSAFKNKTFALHFIRIPYDVGDEKRFLGLARLVSLDRMNQ